MLSAGFGQYQETTMAHEVDRGSAVLRRALCVLRAFTDGKPNWGVRELAREIGVHPATVNRALRALTDEGFLQHESSRRSYSVGPELYRMSARIQYILPMRAALTVMEGLVAESGETASLGVYDPQRLTYSIVAQIQSENPIRHVARQGYAWPLHAGAPPQAVLAFLGSDVIDAILSRPLAQFTPRTTTDPVAMRKLLSRIRKLGYAHSRGQAVTGGVAIAAPVWDARGIWGSLVLTMPESRCRNGAEKTIGPKVQTAAGQLSSALGGSRE
jgi:DNA-binding IclR family transcriptional regulator